MVTPEEKDHFGARIAAHNKKMALQRVESPNP